MTVDSAAAASTAANTKNDKKPVLADIDEDEDDDGFPGFVVDEEVARDVSIGDDDEDDDDDDDDADDDYADYILEKKIGALSTTLRDLLTVKYAPDDGGDGATGEVTEEPVAYTVAAIKDDLESLRVMLEVSDEKGRVEYIGESVARLCTAVNTSNTYLRNMTKILYNIHRTLEATAKNLGVQVEKKNHPDQIGGGDQTENKTK
jgi:hypothetical protein